MVKTVNTKPEDVKYVIQTHLHLDHSGAIDTFPNATHITQKLEYDYAFNPDWFSQPAYIRADLINQIYVGNFFRVEKLIFTMCTVMEL